MLTFTGTFNQSRLRKNWNAVVKYEFHKVELKKCNFLNFKIPYF